MTSSKYKEKDAYISLIGYWQGLLAPTLSTEVLNTLKVRQWHYDLSVTSIVPDSVTSRHNMTKALSVT